MRLCRFLVKAKKNDDTGKNTLTMTFEVCRLAQMDLTGIRLTRVKGDTWAYKKVYTLRVAIIFSLCSRHVKSYWIK